MKVSKENMKRRVRDKKRERNVDKNRSKNEWHLH